MQRQTSDCSGSEHLGSVHAALARLRTAYGEPSAPVELPPIDELVATILSQNTSDVNTARSFSGLRKRFPHWEDVLAASDTDVSDAIRSGGLADTKGPRIRRVLAEVKERQGSFDLSFLATMPIDSAKDWLISLPGVGPKTAACVLLFSLHMPAMPVDTHVHRVAGRLGWIPLEVSAERAHDLLEQQIDPREMLSAHLLMITHGRLTCTARRPACAGCVLVERCPSAVQFVGERRARTCV